MRRLALLFAVLALGACGKETSDAQAEGFIRLPSPGASMTAAYLTVQVDEANSLVAVSVEGVGRTEMHVSFEEDGISRMRQVERYDIAAGEMLVLEPGGRHLMLMALEDPFLEGETREVTLTFASGEERVVTLPVKRTGGGHSNHGSH